MISKERFNNIRKGDIIITKTKKGKKTSRLVLESVKNKAVKVKGVYWSQTVYAYSDLYKSIIEICKKKDT